MNASVGIAGGRLTTIHTHAANITTSNPTKTKTILHVLICYSARFYSNVSPPADSTVITETHNLLAGKLTDGDTSQIEMAARLHLW